MNSSKNMDESGSG
jgi:hypothetical protein